jgi:nucleotide-binding universal stress UspA family protein
MVSGRAHSTAGYLKPTRLPSWPPEATPTARRRPGPACRLLAAAQDADMIVVGSRGTGGFARLLMGSLSTQVSHHARCPVVIVPAEDHG